MGERTKAYRSGREHLEDELAWVQEGFRTLMDIGGGDPQANPYASRRGLLVTMDELLQEPPTADEIHAMEQWKRYAAARMAKEREIAERAKSALDTGADLPLIMLTLRLRLSAWERRFLALCMAPELDRQYEKWFGYFNDDVTCKAATPDLACRLLADGPGDFRGGMDALGGGGTLRRVLLEEEDEYADYAPGALVRPRLKTPLRLDDRTVSFLLGTENLDARITDFATLYDPSGEEPLPALGDEDPLASRWRGWENGSSSPGTVPFVHMWGPRGGGKKLRLRHLARARNQRLLEVRLSALPSDAGQASTAAMRIVREALLTGAAVCLEEEHAAPGSAIPHREAWEAALRLYASFSGKPLLAWVSNVRRQASELPVPAGAAWLAGGIAPPPASERIRYWADTSGMPESEWRQGWRKEIADKFRFTPGQIFQAWRQAAALAAASGGDSPDRPLVESACRGQYRHRLAQLADRMTPARTWSDLVLPPEPLSLIKEACSQFRFRETVYEEWGFGRKLPYGRGLSLLFAGPPGTGKTMAAEIVAGELGLELYRIDLSRIVSKYIGETEQRLSELFAEAENSGAILFFDEGDALFGKRTEVKDAHDKYANMEAAYLLQRIEAYDGVTMLATNLLQNMDEALLRRMSFVVKFPFPDAADRERIFRAHLPPGAPLDDDLDLAFLAARLDVSGGYIKNIVLAAAFLAASANRPIGMAHFVRAARQELRKMGKILVKEMFSPYFEENTETFG